MSSHSFKYFVLDQLFLQFRFFVKVGILMFSDVKFDFSISVCYKSVAKKRSL
jgi:hypothetical protein